MGCHHRKRHCVRGVAVLLLAAGDCGVLERSRGLCRAVSDARPHDPVFDHVRAEKVKVTEAIQETLDCVREIRATNQEAHYLEGSTP